MALSIRFSELTSSRIQEESRILYLARALYDAVEDCNIQQVNTLLYKKNASPNVFIPEEGMTPFHLAAGHENLAFGKVVTSLFLHNGGDPNVRCEGNRTVLHIAVAWNRSIVVETLLRSSYIVPDLYTKDDDNLNVFNYAVKYKAWESLATLQSFLKLSKFISKSNDQVCKEIQPSCVEKEDSLCSENPKPNQSIGIESTFNKSDRLHTSSGYFNSGESLDSTSKSIKNNSVGLNNNILSESTNDILNKNISLDYLHTDSTSKSIKNNSVGLNNILSESTNDILNKNISLDYLHTDSTSKSVKNNSVCLNNILSESTNDILSKNISLDYLHTELGDIPSDIYFDTTMNSIKSENHDIENIEDISFPSIDLTSDCEFNEIELTSENISNKQNEMYSSNTDWMTDISGLCSSEEYFTCSDTISKQHVINNKSDKIDEQLEDITNNMTMTSFYDSIRPISEMSEQIVNKKVSNHYSSSEENSSDLTEITEDYETDYVRFCLRKYGFSPGPLVPSTKQLYVRKLNRIKRNQVDEKQVNEIHINISSEMSYSNQLINVLIADEHDTWKKMIKSWNVLEKDIVYRNSGSSFTYLLLDPRITKNLPARVDQIDNSIEVWQTFISSIFYIGKGTKTRPNDHMIEAFNSWIKQNNKKMSRKSEHILSLWKQRIGVVCVQAFHHLVLKEAHIREAAMIDAIGLNNLTNEKRGVYYDNTIRWKNSDRCKLGCHLLYRAMLVFLADGERQLQPIDLT